MTPPRRHTRCGGYPAAGWGHLLTTPRLRSTMLIYNDISLYIELNNDRRSHYVPTLLRPPSFRPARSRDALGRPTLRPAPFRAAPLWSSAPVRPLPPSPPWSRRVV